MLHKSLCEACQREVDQEERAREQARRAQQAEARSRYQLRCSGWRTARSLPRSSTRRPSALCGGR